MRSRTTVAGSRHSCRPILSTMPLDAEADTYEYARLVAGACGLFGVEERVSGIGPAREHERVQRVCRLSLVVGQ